MSNLGDFSQQGFIQGLASASYLSVTHSNNFQGCVRVRHPDLGQNAERCHQRDLKAEA
jgi:hypothetical protein